MRAALTGLLLSAACSAQPVAPPPARAPTPPRPRVEVETLSSGARRIRIADPERYWDQAGFVKLAPTVRLAVSARNRPNVAVYLRVPADTVIRSQQLTHPTRSTLVFPPGSEADRVSMTRYGSQGFTIADVRGSRLDAHGHEWFHVYRPTSAAPHAPLIGFEWRRDDRAQREEAQRLLVNHVRSTPRPLARRPPAPSAVAFFERMNECEACHVPNKAASTDPDDWRPLWPTDQTGWYVPLAVMLPSLALSTTRQWHDPNADDPWVVARCREQPAERLDHALGSWFRCVDGSVPEGSRDMPEGIAHRDRYTEEVCASRRYLFERMDSAARERFRTALAPCREPRASFLAPRRAGALRVQARRPKPIRHLAEGQSPAAKPRG